jgi:hypothetical protein
MDKELNLIIQQLRQLGVEAEEIKKIRAEFNKVKGNIEEASKFLDRMENRVYRLRDASNLANSSFADLSRILQDNVRTLTRKDDAIQKAIKSSKGLRDISQQMRTDEEEITKLSDTQLSKLLKKAKIEKDNLAVQATYIADRLKSTTKGLKMDEEGYQLDRNGNKLRGAFLTQRLKSLVIAGKLNESEADLLSKMQAGLADEEVLIQKIQQRLKFEKDVNKQLGLTGSAVKLLGNLTKGLGLDAEIFSQAIEKSKTGMREVAEQAINSGQSVNKLKLISKGLAPIGQAFLKTLFSTEIILGKTFVAFLELDKTAAEFGRLTGQNARAVAGLNDRLATSIEILQLSAEFTRQTGLAATSVFTNEDLARLTEAKNLLGLSVEQAGKLGLFSKVSGVALADFNENVLQGVSSMNELRGSVVAPGQALQDVLSTSDDIALSLGGNPELLGKAATAARALGLELSKVDRIAESLLDFESSIEAELEAQLLTGKQINLAKARELALNNDLAGLSNELAKNGASAAEFANMNRIQQNALARALRMSREELAKTIIAQDTQGKLTDEQKRKILGVNQAQLEQISAQEKLNKSVQKLAQAFAPVLDIIIPIIDGISAILIPLAKLISSATTFLDGLKDTSKQATSFKNILVDIAKVGFGAALLFGLRPLVGKIITIGKNILGLGSTAEKTSQSIFTSFSDKFKKLKSSFTDIFKDKAKQAADKTIKTTLENKSAEVLQNKGKETAESLADKAKDKLGGKTEDLAGEVKKEDKGFSAIEQFNKLDTKSMLRGAAAIAVLSGALFITAKAFQQFADVTWESVAQGLVAIGGLTVAAFALSKIKKPVIEGSIALAILGAALIPFAAALRIMTPAIEAFGNVISKALAGLAPIIQTAFSGINTLVRTVADSFQRFFDSLSLDKIGSIALLGPALLSASAGLAVFSAALGILGPALGTFGVTAAPAIPILLTLSGAALALGGALRLAAPDFIAFGQGIKTAFEGLVPVLQTVFSGITTLVQTVADSFQRFFDSLSLDKIGSIVLLGPALLSASGGLAVFGAALAGASIGSGLSSLMGGGVLGSLENLANMAQPLSSVGISLTAIATGIAGIAAALATLETEKLDEIKDLVITTAFAAPAIAASGAITELISGITGGSQEQSSNKELVDKMNELIAAVKAGGHVYMDGNKVGQALVLASTKLS